MHLIRRSHCVGGFFISPPRRKWRRTVCVSSDIIDNRRCDERSDENTIANNAKKRKEYEYLAYRHKASGHGKANLIPRDYLNSWISTVCMRVRWKIAHKLWKPNFEDHILINSQNPLSVFEDLSVVLGNVMWGKEKKILIYDSCIACCRRCANRHS